MSYYVADVGEVIIKPEYRADFGHFFRREYDRIEQEPLKSLANDVVEASSLGGLVNMSKWSHYDMLKDWEGRFAPRYDKVFGGFIYGVSYYNGPRDFFTELLPEITEKVFEKESLQHEKTIASSTTVYFSEVGRVIIKPEYREDFDHFFRGEYSRLQTELMKEFVKKHLLVTDHFIELCYWKHDDCKEEWRGKYETTYDEDSGRFVYGVCYNLHSRSGMLEFFDDILPAITQEVISEDGWAEPS